MVNKDTFANTLNVYQDVSLNWVATFVDTKGRARKVTCTNPDELIERVDKIMRGS